MICLSYVKQIANLPSFLCKISCFSYKTSCSCSKLGAKAIYIVDGNLIKRHIAKNFSFMNPVNHLLFFVLNHLSIIDAIFIEESWNSIFILIIPICAEVYFVIISGLLGSL